jgi:hypothetical protein
LSTLYTPTMTKFLYDYLCLVRCRLIQNQKVQINPLEQNCHQMANVLTSTATKRAAENLPSRSENRVPAELPTRWEQFEGMEYAHLRYAQQDGTDGAWWCSECNHENLIVHYQGSHPSGMMNCAKCGSVVSQHCHRSDIFTILDWAPGYQFTVAGSFSGEVPYGSVCPQCGLSHRALLANGSEETGRQAKRLRFFKRHGDKRKTEAHAPAVTNISFKAICECGNLNNHLWLRFHIGSNEDWRLTRNEVCLRVTELRSRQAISELYENSPMPAYTGKPLPALPDVQPGQTATEKPLPPLPGF